LDFPSLWESISERGGEIPLVAFESHSTLSVETFVLSDYRSFREQEEEADVPVPADLLPRSQRQLILGKLKKSQKIGLLLWLESEGLIALGGRERLLYLQGGASVEALQAGMKFFSRLSEDEKLQKDFKHALREINSRPTSRTFRTKAPRRIGVGYRDKGTLPLSSSRIREEAIRDSWVPTEPMNEFSINAIRSIAPFCLSEDGMFLDSQVLSQYLKPVWALPESWGLPS
jgi:hypothetical protein